MLTKLWKSLIYALKGVQYGFVTRKNMTVFGCVGMLVAALLIWLGTSKIKFAIIMASWMLVIIIEITNTAIEKVIDTIHPGYSKDIGHAKDVMAGAVFISLITAICTTILMIWDPLIAKIMRIM